MQKTLAVLGLVALLALTVPLSSATNSYTDVLPGKVAVLVGPADTPSNPALQSSRQFNIVANVGDTISAALTYTDAGTNTPNDLDLTLLFPKDAPVPLPIPPTEPSLIGIVNTRYDRETCTDAAAQSANHPLLGGSFDEALTYTVDGTNPGTFALVVRGFSMSAAQPYTLTITVTDGAGNDVTASRVTADPLLGQATSTTLITTNPHCELI
jgi:hypothetical protein